MPLSSIIPNGRVLTENASFRSLWIARTLSFAGSNATTTALMLMVAQRYGVQAVAVLLIAQGLPRLFGPIAGTLADRFEPRSLMICCDISNVVVTLALILTLASLPWLLLFVVLSNTFGAAFSVTARGSLPGLVETKSLPEANAWLVNAFMLQGAIGPVLGTALYASIGAPGALAVDAVSFLISAFLIRRLPALSSTTIRVGSTFWKDVMSGSLMVKDSPLLRWLFFLTGGAIFFGSFDNVALVFLARDTFQSGAFGYGALFTSFAVGTIVSALALTRAPSPAATARVLLLGTAVGGIGALGTGLAPVLAVACAAQFMVGLAGGVLGVAQETMLQSAVPRSHLGRVAGLSSAVAFLVSSSGFLVGGWILAQSGPRYAFLVGGIGTSLLALMTFPVLAREWRKLCAAAKLVDH